MDKNTINKDENMENDIFVKITNRDIYNKLVRMEHKIDKLEGIIKLHSALLAIGGSILFIISKIILKI